MTLANCQRLYKHYVSTGQTARAEELVKKRPELAQAPKEKKK